MTRIIVIRDVVSQRTKGTLGSTGGEVPLPLCNNTQGEKKMRQNVNPVVAGIVFVVVLIILILIGIKVFGGGGGSKPQPMDYKVPPPAASAAHSQSNRSTAP